MYVCMSVCMYICMYVCMYVSMCMYMCVVFMCICVCNVSAGGVCVECGSTNWLLVCVIVVASTVFVYVMHIISQQSSAIMKVTVFGGGSVGVDTFTLLTH